jgi:ribonuclease BN (tRNA processing enzyme)
VELTVLGSSGTWPPAGGATCGYLVSHEGTHIWLDAGTGTFANLQRHVAIGDIAAIMITHGHPDHFMDVVPAFYARHYGGLGDPGLPFYSPEGFTNLLSLLVSEDGRDVMAQAYSFRTLVGGDRVQIGPFDVRAFEMSHVGVNALGYRIEAGGVVFAYTGDTGPSDAVVEMAHDADALMAEASYQDASNLLPFHLSARQAAEHAKAAGVGRLLLTHILPTLDPEVSLAEARSAFDGTVEVAEEGMITVIGP